MARFSVLILTLNEERNLPLCLSSIRDCDDVVVLDSGSTDQTQGLARQANARVFERRFDSFAGQRNFAQENIPFRYPWVFHLDADEQFMPELTAECDAVAREDLPLDGYYVAPRMLFQGRWVRHCTDFPAWQARFVRAPQFRFIDVGHGQRESPAMRMGRIRANYLHNLSAESEAEWLEKHQRYARAEAAQAIDGPAIRWTRMFSRDALERRRALKQLSTHLPARPLARFLYQYVIRRGFLDGPVAFHYCRLLARYEGFIAQETRALRARRRST